jgi:signal transduction histidine kinase
MSGEPVKPGGAAPAPAEADGHAVPATAGRPTDGADGADGHVAPGPPRPAAARRHSRPPLALARLAAEDAASRWPLGRIIGAGMLALGLVVLAAIIAGALALHDLSASRAKVVAKIDPAAFRGSQLYADMLNQETGVRGYLLSGQRSFLAPYTTGVAGQARDVRALRPLLAGLPGAQRDLSTALSQLAAWRTGYAEPAIRIVAATGKPLPGANIAAGKTAFNGVRGPLAALQRDLAAQRSLAVSQLNSSAAVLDSIGITSAVALLVVIIALGLGLRTAAISPLTRLAGDARRVAGGEFGHEVDPSGPREVHTLAVDVNRMRQRILMELSAVQAANVALEARALELERSNAELEQFAYVASHDLQEPLRKVASFCQLLQRRYIGQLDARADQYIEFAVDGAKRMQALIDDLLAFSRVGRIEREAALVSCASALSQARVNLASEIRKSGAVIETTELPLVRAEFSLLTSLFQNLISNAIKFHGESPPVVKVSATRQDDGFWQFSVADNGIGIEPEYADRIFVIFQRLHDRNTYAGTGIGLAMCRKIVEHYGGRIWLDTGFQDGARFCFTLPVTPADDEEPSYD